MAIPDVIKYTSYEFDQAKDIKLRLERGIGFKTVISILQSDQPVKGGKHPNGKKYPNQFVYEIEIEGYIYIVPFVVNEGKAFLKTIYPSRKATRKKESSKP